MRTAIRRTTVMLPTELHDRLAAQAREAERSVAAEVRVAILAHVRSDREPKKAR